MFQFIKNLFKPAPIKPVSFPLANFLTFYTGTGYESNARACYNEITIALTSVGIFSGWTLLGALATARVEVGRSFLPIPEYGTGQEYEGREDLGNIYPGDGPKYKGRGYIQLTGRNNYQNYGLKLGIDLIGNPELALTPQNAAKILALYFRETGANIACDNNDWVKVRQIVNGGTNGLALFQNIIKQYSQKTIIGDNKKMETAVKWVKFFTSNVAEYQTVSLTVGDDGKKVHLQDDGETHQFTDAADAVARSTSEVFIFWDNVPVGVGSQAA